MKVLFILLAMIAYIVIGIFVAALIGVDEYDFNCMGTVIMWPLMIIAIPLAILLCSFIDAFSFVNRKLEDTCRYIRNKVMRGKKI